MLSIFGVLSSFGEDNYLYQNIFNYLEKKIEFTPTMAHIKLLSCAEFYAKLSNPVR